MTTAALLDLIGRMRQADLYVLVLMLIAHQQGAEIVTAQWLRDRCTYSQDVIGTSLIKLSHWGLAEQPLRYHWRLTSAGRQLSLPMVGELPPTVTPLIAESGSSSSSLNKELIDSSLQLLPLLPATPLIAESNPEATRLAVLLQDLGCPRALAREAVADALDHDNPELVEAQLLLWRHYCASPAGRSIQAVGLFVARKIQNGERAPSSARQSLKQLPHPEATGQPWDPARDWPHPDYVRLLELTEAPDLIGGKGDSDAP